MKAKEKRPGRTGRDSRGLVFGEAVSEAEAAAVMEGCVMEGQELGTSSRSQQRTEEDSNTRIAF